MSREFGKPMTDQHVEAALKAFTVRNLKCCRCGEHECICGDPAVEKWIANELDHQNGGEHSHD